VKAPIREHRHDLAWWQRGEFGLVGGEQDPLAIFFAEAEGHVPVAGFAAVDAITAMSELPEPALQRGEAHAQPLG